ncbi:protein of unknown function (plasmid) [Pararobbsia alpina]
MTTTEQNGRPSRHSWGQDSARGALPRKAQSLNTPTRQIVKTFELRRFKFAPYDIAITST